MAPFNDNDLGVALVGACQIKNKLSYYVNKIKNCTFLFALFSDVFIIGVLLFLLELDFICGFSRIVVLKRLLDF